MSIATAPHPASPRTALGDLTARAAVVPITLEQYQRMIDEGIFSEDSSVELLSGVLVRKDRSVIGENPMGHSPLHRLVVALLTSLTSKVNSERRHLQIQLPIACPPDGAPEPDASIIRGVPRDYPDRLPGPDDVFCVIEAAHSSLDRDREDKLPIYAAARVAQYMVINLQNSTIEVHADPDSAAGVYRTKTTASRGAMLRVHLGEDQWLDVRADELLP
ncbi:MAG: Uma2 family endonuclease [Tepidisphaeraceae bacterium]